MEALRQSRLILLGHAGTHTAAGRDLPHRACALPGVPAAYTEARRVEHLGRPDRNTSRRHAPGPLGSHPGPPLVSARLCLARCAVPADHAVRPLPAARSRLPDRSQFACAALAGDLRKTRFAGLVGSAAFMWPVSTRWLGLKSWLIPWTTTPEAALTFTVLVAALRLAGTPAYGRVLLAGGADRRHRFLPARGRWAGRARRPVALAPRLSPCRSPRRRHNRRIGVRHHGDGCGGRRHHRRHVRLGPGPTTPLRRFRLRAPPAAAAAGFAGDRRAPDLDGVGAERIEPGLHRGLAGISWIIAGAGGITACSFHRDKRIHILLTTWLVLHLALVLSSRDLHIEGVWLMETIITSK